MRRLNNEKQQLTQFLKITANQIMHTLIMDSKTENIKMNTKIVRKK